MAKVEGLAELTTKLKVMEERSRAESSPSVTVGYTQAYALFVHENMEAKHPVGRAKFLEEPFRQLAPELARQVAEDVKKGMTLDKALLKAGLRIQRESMRLVPVDTGALRASAFTRLDKGK